MKTVMVLGCDGYIGHALTLRLLNKGYKVIGVDNLSRRKMVSDFGSYSALPIESQEDRHKRMIATYRTSRVESPFLFFNIDIAEKKNRQLESLFASYGVDTIYNVAGNPSIPWSHSTPSNTYDQVLNNVMSTVNILTLMNLHCKDAHLINVSTMNEYHASIDVDIPEDEFRFEYNGKTSKVSSFPKKADSYYESTCIANSYMTEMASKTYGLKVTNVRLGMVYGAWTSDIEESGIHTRLDGDECFATTVNRFILQSMLDRKITLTPNATDKKALISLSDTIDGLMIVGDGLGHNTYCPINMFTSVSSMKEVSELLSTTLEKIDNTTDIRSYRTEDGSSGYKPVMKRLTDFGFHGKRFLVDEVLYLKKVLNKKSIEGIPTNSFHVVFKK